MSDGMEEELWSERVRQTLHFETQCGAAAALQIESVSERMKT